MPMQTPELRLQLFSRAQCVDLAERLLDVEAFWLTRHVCLPFYTLGATNYYDISANPARPYERLAQQYNPLLLRHFSDVYTVLQTALQQRLQQPVVLLSDAAVPGFHLFGAHAAFAQAGQQDIMHASWFQQRDGGDFPGSPIHVDTAHLALGYPDLDSGRTISFTLAIALPQSGAGMKIWPLTADQTQGWGDEKKLQLLQATPSRAVHYQAGELFVHSGDYYHQACGFPVHAGQYRFTLQGHGIFMDGQWHLFW